MHYPIVQWQFRRACRLFTAILIISVSFSTFHSNIYADSRHPSSEEYRIQGYAEQQKGNYKRALTYYTKAISLGLNNAVVYNDMGVVYEHLGDGDKAQEYYLKAISTDPDYLPPYTNLAFFYESRGDIPQAIDYFQERLNRGQDGDPWQERVRKELYKINPAFRERKLREEARDLSQKLIDEAHNEFSLQVERAEKHYQRGKQCLVEKSYDEAITEFDRALALTPDNPKIIKARDLALYEKDVEEIKRHATRAIEKLEAGDLESSKKEFQKVLTILPNESVQISE